MKVLAAHENKQVVVMTIKMLNFVTWIMIA